MVIGGLLLGLAVDGGSPSAPRCRATVRFIAANATIAVSDMTPVACRAGAPRAALRYDRVDGVLVAADDLPAGTYLGVVAPLDARSVAKGTALTLRSIAGPVVIERSVTAMQAGRPGKRLFVRDSEGKVFAVPLADASRAGVR